MDKEEVGTRIEGSRTTKTRKCRRVRARVVGGRRWIWKTRRVTRANSKGGGHAPPSREVSSQLHTVEQTDVNHEHVAEEQTYPVNAVEADIPETFGTEIPTENLADDPNVFTRKTDPFNPRRVQAIVEAIEIGADLSPEQRQEVEDELKSFADVFALSVGEVLVAEGGIHKLNIPEGARFSKSPKPRNYSPPQREYLYNKLDEMAAADIIERVPPDMVKCVSPITLAKKAH
ncbi:hypothetical protein K435DRAFT_689093, partial [Dendrothele bispora CBS 962.96]